MFIHLILTNEYNLNNYYLKILTNKDASFVPLPNKLTKLTGQLFHICHHDVSQLYHKEKPVYVRLP